MQNNFINMAIQRILNNNPQAKQLYESLKGKNEQELKEYAENVAKGRGIDLHNFLGQYGFRY